LSRKTSVITFRVADTVAEQLRNLAKKRNTTINTVLTDAVIAHLRPTPQRSGDEGGYEYDGNHSIRAVSQQERNRIAHWVSLIHPVLSSFRLRLEGVEEDIPDDSNAFFVGSRMEKRLILSAAITALGTWLYGGRGLGRGCDKERVNALKKQADAISAYILSEALFFSSRGLRENHALMVSLGEGWMPKGGETPEEGANPQIAFGRVFARPDVSSILRNHLRPLLDPERNEPGWKILWDGLARERLTVWGAVIDTLENTSRFTLGDQTGPMVVLHVFDQPLIFTSPYESYMGGLTLPKEVVETAAHQSVAIHYLTPRAKVLEAIRSTYPGIPPENVHVWALGGPKRAGRLARLWAEWKDLNVHVVEDGWRLPDTNTAVFTDSGTYAPVYRVGVFEANGQTHLFLTDGYASTAEAIQAASLDRARRQRTFLCPFTPEFLECPEVEQQMMQLEAKPRLGDDLTDLRRNLSRILGRPISEEKAREHNNMLLAADRANLPRRQDILTIDDFLPNKDWQCLAVSASILDDPYSGMTGVRKVMGPDNEYRVCVRSVASNGRERRVILTLALRPEALDDFSPLLDRLCGQEPYEQRAIKSSDVGRILNELRTWSWNSVFDVVAPDGVKTCVNLDSVDEIVIPAEKRKLILRILKNYIRDYPALAGHVQLSGRLAREV
jgi:hypothetical protein